ncbi:MAG: hypothetical protein NVSMB48_10070 [Marmoricola sp.]
MRLESLTMLDVLPVRRFEISDLSDVVVIAGPNGVGKTRLLNAILALLRGNQGLPSGPVQIRATCGDERTLWGKDVLSLQVQSDLELYQRTLHTLHTNRKRRNWKSSILQFESDRTIQNVPQLQFAWDVVDPSEEEVSWETGFQNSRDRWQDTLHSMFRTIEAQKQSIANRAVSLRRDGKTEMKLNFADPMQPFKDVFFQLLGPKTLVDPSARRQSLEFTADGVTYDISALSSGEREVVNIAFDFLLRHPTDSVVFFDEPELHLHPELSHRLIQTLQGIGERNQFILSTHSPDVITSTLEHSVIFVSPPKSANGTPLNQAVAVAESDETNQALKMLGQSIGIVSLGKKIVLIEGETSSLDKDTYGSILRSRFPELVLVPSGGKHVIQSFETVHDAVLSKSLWGVEFFMLCDRDASPAGASVANNAGRFRVLEKYHLENYFLEPAVLATCFKDQEAQDHWLRNPSAIREEIRTLARPLLSYAVALDVSASQRKSVGNVSIMPKNCHNLSAADVTALLAARARVETSRVEGLLTADAIADRVSETFSRLETSLDDDTDLWLREIPGKQLLASFASRADIKLGRLKTLYVKSAQIAAVDPFAEITDIFNSFNIL